MKSKFFIFLLAFKRACWGYFDNLSCGIWSIKVFFVRLGIYIISNLKLQNATITMMSDVTRKKLFLWFGAICMRIWFFLEGFKAVLHRNELCGFFRRKCLKNSCSLLKLNLSLFNHRLILKNAFTFQNSNTLKNLLNSFNNFWSLTLSLHEPRGF